MKEIISFGICKNCKRTFEDTERPCPHCGCTDRDVNVTVTDLMNIKDNIRLKKYKDRIKKYLVKIKKGWFPSRDERKHPEGVYLHQEAEPETNLYKKKVIDVKTGQIVKDLEEPLDKHTSM